MGADLILAFCDWPQVENIDAAIDALSDQKLEEVRAQWVDNEGYDLQELLSEAASAKAAADQDSPALDDSDGDMPKESFDTEDSEDTEDQNNDDEIFLAFRPGWQPIVRNKLRDAFPVLGWRCCARLTIHEYDIAIAGDMTWGDEPDGIHEIMLIGASGIGQITETARVTTNGIRIQLELPPPE